MFKCNTTIGIMLLTFWTHKIHLASRINFEVMESYFKYIWEYCRLTSLYWKAFIVSTIDSRYIAAIYNTIAHTAITVTILRSSSVPTNDTAYLALTGELWGVFRESLTQWGRIEIDAITQTTFSSAFFWKKMFEFQQKFHWSPGDKPLSEPMMVSLLTHICVTRP